MIDDIVIESTASPVLGKTPTSNKMGLCSHCKPMQEDPPSLLKCEKMNWNTSDTAEAAVDECYVIPTEYTEMWSLPSRQDLLFHLLTTNLAYTAHLSTHSPPHILYREISIMSSCSCFLSVFVWLESTLRGLQTLRERWSHTIPGSCLTPIWTCLQCISGHCVFPLSTVYSHTVIHGILEK